MAGKIPAAGLDDGDASGGSARIDYGHTYLAGLFGEIPLTKLSPNLYLRSEIYYSDQSFRVYQPGGPENYNLQVELRRLEIPVQIQYVFTVARFHPFLGAGGQYLYNLQVNKTEAQARPANGGWEWVFKEESDPTRHEIGFVLAGGVHIPLDYRRLLTIQTRYYTAGISSPKEGPSGDYFTLQAGINF